MADGWYKNRRGILDHLATMSDAQAKLFWALLNLAKNVGPDKGTVRTSSRELAVLCNWSQSKANRTLDSLEPRYISREEKGANRHGATVIIIHRYSASSESPLTRKDEAQASQDDSLERQNDSLGAQNDSLDDSLERQNDSLGSVATSKQKTSEPLRRIGDGREVGEVGDAPPTPSRASVIEIRPRGPTEPEDWRPWAHPMEAFDDIAAIYPKRLKVQPARAWWQSWITDAREQGPAIAKRIWDVVRLIAERYPPDEFKFLPSLADFLRDQRWEDDWSVECDRRNTDPETGGRGKAQRRHDRDLEVLNEYKRQIGREPKREAARHRGDADSLQGGHAFDLRAADHP